MKKDQPQKNKAERNRTITLSKEEVLRLKQKILTLNNKAQPGDVLGKTINQNIFDALNLLPEKFVDLLFIDPPYNLTKEFNSNKFKRMSTVKYEEWFDSWFSLLIKTLKPTASVYICGDWNSSAAIFNVMSRYLKVRNRITWEREKGRGAKSNWKNCSEDIWFGTVSKNYFFDIKAAMLKRKVVAPYRDSEGKPKDWSESEYGNYRLTHPSNLWTDITVPFWSMSENTEHPTQKPEKLLAKIILPSSKPGDVVFDPFLGSGTTSVVAKKLNRNYCGVDIDEFFCCLAEKRLEIAEYDKTIQGCADGVFWERNSLNKQNKNGKNRMISASGNLLEYVKI